METALGLIFARVLMTTGEWTVLRGAPANTVSAMLVSQTQHASRSSGEFRGGGEGVRGVQVYPPLGCI